MAKPKSIYDCKTGNDVRRLAEQQAVEREDVEIKFSGPHPVLKVHGRGAMPLPCNHGSKQLGKGLLCALRRQWKALGLVLFPIFIFVLVHLF